MKITVLRQTNEVIIDLVTNVITISIQDAYFLASDLLRELDRTNPLLRDSE